jgi:predicted CoA-binding protein
MTDLYALLLRSDTSVAVVGATDAPDKYGSVIYRDLKRKGYRVFPVNPGRTVVDGDECYASLAGLPAAPTIVAFVVPPEVTLALLEEAAALGYTAVWIQPGAEDRAVLDYLRAGDFSYLAGGPCIMVESPALPRST